MNFLFVELNNFYKITYYDIPNTGNLDYICCNINAEMNDYNRNSIIQVIYVWTAYLYINQNT